MSTQERRQEALELQRKPLMQRLKDVRILVPDQKKAAHMMEAARLGLPVNASRLRVRTAWWRRWAGPDWTIFDYDAFVSDPKRNDYGGLPLAVSNHVERLRAAVPDIKLKVHARIEDPWLLTDDGIILRGWMFGSIVL